MSELHRALLVLAPGASAAEAKREIAERGGRVLHAYGPAVLVFEGDDELVRSVGGHTGPFDGDLSHLDETGRMGVDGWNAALSRSFREAKLHRKGEGRSWEDNTDD